MDSHSIPYQIVSSLLSELREFFPEGGKHIQVRSQSLNLFKIVYDSKSFKKIFQKEDNLMNFRFP